MGGVRTALYNYLFAKHNNGSFILRIEDTDQSRYVPGAEDYILEALQWCGITPDEGPGSEGEFGPYRQSDRKDIYREHVDKLIQSGHAYYAFDTPDELEKMRSRLKEAKADALHYNAETRKDMRNSNTLSPAEVESLIASGTPYVIRVDMPRNESIEFHDEIRGLVSVESNTLDDKVIFKSDGMPTYHLANVVDDHMMKISHVIRGEEWLPSAPLHVILYRFFGWEETMPKFAHLPLILKPDGNGKLSKRDGDRLGFPVFPLEWTDPANGQKSSGYRESGYFPEAFVNMLALLGWNPGTEQELFSMEELIKSFSLERVGKSGAKFSAEKTIWFNEQHLRNMSNDGLAELIYDKAARTGFSQDKDYLAKTAGLMKERVSFADEILDAAYLFAAPNTFDEKTVRKKWKENSAELMMGLKGCFEETEPFTAEQTESSFKDFIEKQGVPLGAVLPVFRVLVTGKGGGPSMFDVAELLGKEETISRIEAGIKKLNS